MFFPSIDHQEEGLISGLGHEFGVAFGDKFHIQGIDVIPPVVVELERIARSDVELADDPGSIVSVKNQSASDCLCKRRDDAVLVWGCVIRS